MYPKANLKQAWTPDEEADSIVGSYRTPLTAPYPVLLPSEPAGGMWPVAGFPIPFLEHHRKNSHCRCCGRSRWVPFHHPVLLREAIKLAKLKPFANSRGGFQRAPDSFPFTIIIKRLGDAGGSAISPTSPESSPKGGPPWDQKSFPSVEPVTFSSATELVFPL